MISVSQVTNREDRIVAWEKARESFAKDICHYCAEEVDLIDSIWTGPGRKHVVGGDLGYVSCLADNIWALDNPIKDPLVQEPGVHFDFELSHVIRLAVEKVGVAEVSKFLEVNEKRIKSWVWGRGSYPAPSLQDLFCSTLRDKFNLEESND